MMYRLFYIQCFKLYFEVSEDFQTLSLTLFSNVEILRFDVFIARGSLFFLWQLCFYSVAGSSSSTTSFFSKFFLDDFFPLFFLFFFCFFRFLFFLVGSSFMPDLVSVAVSFRNRSSRSKLLSDEVVHQSGDESPYTIVDQLVIAKLSSSYGLILLLTEFKSKAGRRQNEECEEQGNHGKASND